MSRRASGSEGEFASDKAMASTNRKYTPQNSVNFRLREALSPSPEAEPPSRSRSPRRRDSSYSRNRSRSPFRHGSSNNRRRSRSPYRRDQDFHRDPRGEKRRREDDHYRQGDSPPFKFRHDDGYTRKRDHDYGDRRNYYRGSGRGAQWGHSRRGDGRNDRSRYDERDWRSHRHHSERDRSPPTTHEHDKSEKQNVTRDEVMNGNDMNSSSDKSRRPSDLSTSAGSAPNDQATLTPNPANETVITEPEEPEVEPPAPVDEVSAIEERRRRREAIKAKYKDHNSSLLVQALQSDSAPGTPNPTTTPSTNDHEATSPGSPKTPQTMSAAGSPASIVVMNDEELANNNTGGGEGPSAADYDPSMDRQEHREELVETAPGHEEDPEMAVDTAPKKRKASDDMFASEDEEDEDMFAPPQSEKTSPVAPSGPSKTAKELDKNLLDNWDDPEGYYRIILGELIDGRYNVQSILGKGIFSSVVRAVDTQTNELVAIKIIRNNERMIRTAGQEISILEKLSAADPKDKKHVVKLERTFTHKGHLCMVFENLSINLREVLKKFGRDIGLNLKAVRAYAQQMFLGLDLLKECNILHADIKPDNILVNDARSTLKICDLGSACDASEGEITEYVVSRFYRAPEIIFGMKYDFAIDMWSVGCTLYELFTGKILFTGRTNNQMLRVIMESCGRFSPKVLKKANPDFIGKHFETIDVFRSWEVDKISGKDVAKLINFANKPVKDIKSRLIAAAGGGPGKPPLSESDMKDVNLFADLLDHCLNLNPEKRITPKEALKHPFIQRPAPGKPTPTKSGAPAQPGAFGKTGPTSRPVSSSTKRSV